MAQGNGKRPQRLIGFTEPKLIGFNQPRRRRLGGFVLGGAGLAIAIVGFAAIWQQLATLRGQMQRLEGSLAAAGRAADRAGAADARAIDLLARFGQSAPPAGGGLSARERAFVSVERIALRRHGLDWRVEAVARNDGDTPTRDLHYAGAAGTEPPKPAAGLLLPADAPRHRLAAAAIAPHASVTLPGPVLTPRDRGRTVFVHGVVYYKDVLSAVQHVTQYCWYARLPRLERPQFQPCVHFNCADRECSAGSAE